jgi:hypothetical protein
MKDDVSCFRSIERPETGFEPIESLVALFKIHSYPKYSFSVHERHFTNSLDTWVSNHGEFYEFVLDGVLKAV